MFVLEGTPSASEFELTIEQEMMYNGPWCDYKLATSNDISDEQVQEYRQVMRHMFDQSWQRDAMEDEEE